MANIRLFLDTRRIDQSGLSQLKVALSQNRKTAYISLDVRLTSDQWDKTKSLVVKHPDKKKLNVLLADKVKQLERTILYLSDLGRLKGLDAIGIKSEIEKNMYPERYEMKEQKVQVERDKKLFANRFLSFAECKKESTKEIYMHTYKRMVAFMETEQKLHRLSFEDITREWLTRFDLFLSKTSPSKNARNIHLRNIRAVFNEAIDDEITTFYPFRRFKIRPVATRKRNLKVDDLRTLFNYPCEEHAANYLDIFKLMFMLIGINCVDLTHLKEIRDGRIEFYRAKTSRLYSIKVEPEALEIIERHRGKKYLIDILDRWKNYKDFNLKMNRTLKKIGPVERVGLGGKKVYDPLFPEITTYWARHSWATIAASLDIPRDTIAHALGHGNNTVTDIYIDFDQEKVDIANRKVLDWVLYGKR
ncbi:MAG: site-specific integrase [Muribaculaceae bacterium]|nr:site-specific integrase [Muribaculaceae bacterium]